MDTEDIVKIILDTSKFHTKVKGKDSYRTALKNLDSDLRAFESAIKSATSTYRSSLKSIDEETGFALQSFYVKASELNNIMSALSSKNKDVKAKSGHYYNISTRNVDNLEVSKYLYGSTAQSMAKQAIESLGGTAVVSPSNKDVLKITLPVDRVVGKELSTRQKNKIVTDAIADAMPYSKAEKSRRNEAEQKREEAKQIREEEKRRKEEERQEKARAREEEKKAREKAKTEKRIRSVILAKIIVLANIAKRILSATLQMASENHKMATEAHSVGVSALERRGYDIFDTAHGIEKGTTFGAVKAVQGMFGDITRLDESAISTLSRVMGSDISALVHSGIGGQNPNALLDKILNSYFQQFLSGKNSLGMLVGTEQAKRELISVLQSVSPEIARLFSQMTDDYASGYYGKFGSVEDWRKSVQVNRTGLSAETQLYSAEIGKKYNEILSVVEDLKTSFFTELAISLDGLITKVRNIRVGQSPESKIEEDLRNRNANEAFKEQMRQSNSALNSLTQEEVNRLSSAKNTPLRKGAKEFNYTLQDLANIKLGRTSNYTKAYIARGRDIIDNLAFSSIADEFALMLLYYETTDKINKANKNIVGSGKIDDLTLSDTAMAYFVRERVKGLQGGAMISAGSVDKLPSEYWSVLYSAYKQFTADNSQYEELGFNDWYINHLNAKTSRNQKGWVDKMQIANAYVDSALSSMYAYDAPFRAENELTVKIQATNKDGSTSEKTVTYLNTGGQKNSGAANITFNGNGNVDITSAN